MGCPDYALVRHYVRSSSLYIRERGELAGVIGRS
jgi:hypothetical protein